MSSIADALMSKMMEQIRQCASFNKPDYVIKPQYVIPFNMYNKVNYNLFIDQEEIDLCFDKCYLSRAISAKNICPMCEKRAVQFGDNWHGCYECDYECNMEDKLHIIYHFEGKTYTTKQFQSLMKMKVFL